MPTADATVVRPSAAPSDHALLSPPRPSQRFVYLDVMRAMAVLLVLGAHYPLRVPVNAPGHGFFVVWHRVGWIGVDLFFVLSGFLIGGLLFAEEKKHGQVKYGRFLIRRAFKIWPTYLVLLGCVMALQIKRGHGAIGHRVSQTAHESWPYLLQIQNYFGPLVDDIGHLWSIAVEEHFYLLLPGLLAVMAWWCGRSNGADEYKTRRPFAWIPAIFIITSLGCLSLRIVHWRLHPQFDEFTHHWPTHLRIDSLMTGVALAWMVHFAREKVEPLRKWRWPILLVSMLCFVPFCFPFAGYEMPFSFTIGYTILAVGAAGCVLAAWFAGHSDAKTSEQESSAFVRGFAKIGVFSYSIYLWHMPFVLNLMTQIRNHVADRLHLWDVGIFHTLLGVVYVALAIGFGVASFAFIEKPALALRDRLFPSRTATPLPSQGTGGASNSPEAPGATVSAALHAAV